MFDPKENLIIYMKVMLDGKGRDLGTFLDKDTVTKEQFMETVQSQAERFWRVIEEKKWL